MVLMRAARKSTAATPLTSSSHADEPFPTAQLFLLAICRLAEPVALSSIFPIAYPMVKDFDIFSEKDVYFYAGILVSSFALAEALSGCYWGALSDRIGRKPVLLLGCFGTMLSMLMFGFATNFWMALAARTIGGLLNGNVGVIQTMVAELVKRPEHEPRAYAVMPFVWSIGTILGPLTALTANSSVFPSLPYLLPNLICAGLLFASLVIGYFFLEETLQLTWDHDIQDERPEIEASVTIGGATTESGVDLRSESYGTFNAVAIHEEPQWKVKSNGRSRPESVSSQQDQAITRRVAMLVISLGIYCYHSMAFNHLFTIFAESPRLPNRHPNPLHVVGGLDMSKHELGVVLSVNGIITLFIQGVVFPLLASWFGVWQLFRGCILFFPVIYFIVPYLSVVPSTMLYPGIYASLTIWDFFNIMLYPLVLILIKEAANPKFLGRINGLAASTGAVARCLGPPVAGKLYGVGNTIGFTGLAWWATGAVAIIGTAQLVFVDRPKNMTATIVPPYADEAEYEPKEIIHILVEEVEP